MSPLAEDKQELLKVSHDFVKQTWKDLMFQFKAFGQSLFLLMESYTLIISQWRNEND